MYPGHWAELTPDKPAIVHSATGATQTYGELNDRSNQLAQLMYEAGLRRGDHVCIFMQNEIRFFEVIWAALRSGLYLTTVNRYLTSEEAGYIIDNSESQIVVTSDYLKDIACDLHPHAPNVKRWLMMGNPIEGYEDYEMAIGDQSSEPLSEEPAGALMLYSSGTTGRPKGIYRPLPDASISDSNSGSVMQQALWGFDSNTVYLSPAPLYHAASFGYCMRTLALGGQVVMMQRFDPELSLKYIEQYRITHSQWVPTMFVRMLKLTDELRDRYDLSSHRCAIHAAAPCPVEIKQQMMKWWGPILWEYYAGTERNLSLIHISEPTRPY